MPLRRSDAAENAVRRLRGMMTLAIFFAFVGVGSLGIIVGYQGAIHANHLIADPFALPSRRPRR